DNPPLHPSRAGEYEFSSFRGAAPVLCSNPTIFTTRVTMRYQIYWLLFIAFTLSAVEWYSLAQDFDVVISTTNRKSFTIVDQVKDPAERKAFLALYGKMSPREKAKLAEDFLGAYPQSWLLAQVYEIAAKSYIDLEDYPNA